jgi:CheY-like chemotaxis protein
LGVGGSPGCSRATYFPTTSPTRCTSATTRRFLESLGVETVMVNGGQEAVEPARAGGFDALLLDIVMPEVDGPEALRRIKGEAAAAGREAPPAIAVTGHAHASEIEACVEAGFVGHIAKPISLETLGATIAKLKERSRAR